MPKKLHILFICGWYPSRVFPSNGDFIQRHAEAVNSLHQISVLHIITDKKTTKTELISKNINGVNTHIAYLKPSINLVKPFIFYLTFKKIIKRIGEFDIIHLNEIFPFGLFTFLLHKPFIVSEHWTGYHQPQSRNLSLFHQFMAKKITKKAKFVCPVSKELEISMKNLGLEGTYKNVPNVVNTELFKLSDSKKFTKFTMLHISNMNDDHKNVSGIFRAISKLTIDYHLILIGENSSNYKSLSDELNISENIEFISQIPHREIPKYLQKSNVYLSFSNYETWGIVMVEALACGTPVISTDTGILNELQTHNFATIIPKKDEKALIKAIKSIKNRDFNQQEMYNFVVANFNTKNITKQFNELYQKII